MLVLKIAALALVTGLLVLMLKKDQPAFAFLVSAGSAGAVLALVAQQVQPVLDLVETLSRYAGGQSAGCILRVLGIALIAQFAADLCRESGLAAAANAAELGGRALALLQALPLFQSLVDSLLHFLQ